MSVSGQEGKGISISQLFFSGRCGRRSRRDSFLSFRSLIRMPSSVVGGDPFSHPSGSSVSRPVRVPDRSAAGALSPSRGARPPPGLPGARKQSVPSRVHLVGHDLWPAPPSGSASNRSQTLGWVESPSTCAWATPAAAGWGLGETNRFPSVRWARVSRPLLVNRRVQFRPPPPRHASAIDMDRKQSAHFTFSVPFSPV
jgi:hypothetical protein